MNNKLLLLPNKYYKLQNNELIKTYLKYLLSNILNYNNYNDIISDNFVVSIKSFHPLPNDFITDINDIDKNIKKENNIISFIGKENNIINLFANRPIPIMNCNPIPFTFPIKNKNNIELYNSNIYYYEIQILERHRNTWNDENIVLGFGTINTSYNKYVGSDNNSYGFNSNNGTFKNIFEFKKISRQWNIGDIIGVGIIYNINNTFSLFLTLNGVIIKINSIYIMKQQLTPIISINHSCKIKFNFGFEEFKFNIKNNFNNNIIYSNYNDFISSKCNINKYCNKINLKNKLNIKITIYDPSIIFIPLTQLLDNDLTMTDHMVSYLLNI